MGKKYVSDLPLATELWRIRVEHDLSMQALADRMRVSATSVRQLEAGIREPTVGMLHRFCKAVGMSIAELFARVEREQKNNT